MASAVFQSISRQVGSGREAAWAAGKVVEASTNRGMSLSIVNCHSTAADWVEGSAMIVPRVVNAVKSRDSKARASGAAKGMLQRKLRSKERSKMCFRDTKTSCQGYSALEPGRLRSAGAERSEDRPWRGHAAKPIATGG